MTRPRSLPQQPMLGDWPQRRNNRLRAGTVRPGRYRREVRLSADQCTDIWLIFRKSLHIQGVFAEAEQDFVTAMHVNGSIRFDLAPYGVRAVFRLDDRVGRLFSDNRILDVRIRKINNILAAYFTTDEAAA